MSIRNGLQCCLAFCVMTSLSASSAFGGTRVAVVGGDRDESVSKIVALALVNLSQTPDLELIERDEIRRVLDEQKLNASGITDVSQTISVGKLLRADLFAVVETGTGNQVVPSVIVFDAATGMRYQDAALHAGASDLEKAATSLASQIELATQKRNRRQKDLRLVGFVGVRNADLPRSQDALCETVAFLIERALPHSHDVAILERRRLERVNQERSLPGSDEVNTLLASLSTIDLEVSRGTDGKGLRGTALIKDASKNTSETISVTIGDVDAAALADELQKKLVESLKAAPVVGKQDRIAEARRFDSEAVHQYSHLKYAEAVSAAEAAFALDPASEDYLERLSQYLIQYAVYLYSPKEVGYVKSGERAWMDNRVDPSTLDRLLSCAERGVELNLKNTRFTAHFALFNNSLAALCTRLIGLRKATAISGASTKAIDDFLLLCQRRSLDYCDDWAKKTEADPQHYDRYTAAVHAELGIMRAASLDIDAYADLIARTAGRWVTVTKDIPPRFNQFDGGEILNNVLHAAVGMEWHWDSNGRNFAQRLMPTFQAMQSHSRPLAQLYGHFGQIRGEVLLGTLTEEEGFRRFATVYRPLAESTITSPEPWDPQRTRFATYLAWHTAIDDMPGKDKREFLGCEIVECINFMTSRKELVYKALQLAFFRLDRPTSLKLISQSMVVVDSPEFKELPVEKARLRSYLKTTEQEILRVQPELAVQGTRLPWSKATRLFEVGDLRELSDIVGCVIWENHLYIACLQFENEQSNLALIKTAVVTGVPVILSKVDLAIPARDLAAHQRYRFISATGADQDNIYLATRGAGVVVFPIKGGQPRRIDAADGLPSRNVRSMAIFKDKLYAGFDEGYLVAFDLKASKTEVIASSRRKQKLSPFDDGPVFRVPMLAADPKRHRIAFVIGKHVWQLTPADGTISQVLDLITASPGAAVPKLDDLKIYWSSPVKNDRLLISDPFTVIEIDLQRDRAVEIHSAEKGIFSTWPPNLVINGALWSSSFTRLTLDKYDVQFLPPPDRGDIRFNPHFLETVDGKQVIAADARAVWVLELDEKGSAPAIANPAQQSPPTVAAPTGEPSKPISRCEVKVMVLSEDRKPVDPDICYCQFWSWTSPYDSNGETRYAGGAGQGAKPMGGLARVSIQAGMISVGIQAKGYAPTILGLIPSKADQTLDLGTVILTRGFTWRVKLVNSQGQPIPDAEITALCKYCHEEVKLKGNADGVIELPNAVAEEYSLAIRAPGHQPQKFERVKASDVTAATLTLEPAHPTSGRLLTEAGSPVAGAKIYVMSDRLHSPTTTGRLAAVTAADGTFSLDQMNDGWKHPIRVDVEGRPRLALADIPAGQTGVEWKLQPLIRLAGKVKGLGPKDSHRVKYEQCVVDSHGQALAYFFSGETQVDAEGQFTIENLLPGVIRLEAFRKFIEVSLPKSRDDYVLDLAAPVAPRVAADVPVASPAIVPRGKCTVRAVVMNEQGEALQGSCWATTLIAGGSSGQGVTFQRGTVNVDMPPGQVELAIQSPGYAPAIAGPKAAKAGDVIDFGTITLTRGFAWSILAVDEAGQPVTGAVLSVACRFGNAPVDITSNSEGRATLQNAADIEFDVSVRATGYQPKGTTRLKATSTGDAPTLVLKKSNPTNGIIVDENDQPVADAQIIQSFAIGPKTLAQTDSMGRFVLDELADNVSYLLRVEVASRLRLVVANVKAGQKDVTWKLVPSLVLSGRVNGLTDETNRRLYFNQHIVDPQQGYRNVNHHGIVLVDSEGLFRIEGLIPGLVTLSGFQRSVDVDLPESRSDFVLDLTAPDPSQPQTLVTIRFEDDGKAMNLNGTLKGTIMTPRTSEKRRPSENVSRPLSIALKDQSSVEFRAFVPGSVRLLLDAIQLPSHCFSTQTIDFKPNQTTVVVKLLPLGTITGTVRDQAGTPVAGAFINVGQGPGGPPFVVNAVQTDDKGEFTTRIPLEKDVVIRASAGNRFAQSEKIRISPGNTQNVDLKLSK